MNKYAFINTNGTVNHIIKTAIQDEYVDGQAYNDGKVAKDITGLDVSNKYWNGASWADIPVKPGTYYSFTGSTWVFEKSDYIQECVRKRDNYLIGTDWTQVADVPLTDAEKAAWRVYRQELRDFPPTLQDINNENDVVWPTPP